MFYFFCENMVLLCLTAFHKWKRLNSGFQFYSCTTPLRSQDYGIVGSALAVGRFLIVNLIEQRHLFVVGGSVVF
jgi:hypothetical protein